MPELPEVEVVARGLRRFLPGRTVTALRCDGKLLRRPVPVAAMEALLVGVPVSTVSRRAKYLVVTFASRARLVIHLGMTGKLGLFEPDRAPHPHDHVCWSLDHGLELRFNDIRRFGSISVIPPELSAQTLFDAIGPEPFDASFTGRYLYDLGRLRGQPIKNFIMNSAVVAGIGNIYANESLFGAGIRPTRKIGAIGLQRWENLVEEIRAVLSRAIECGGSSINDFLGTDGERGYFQIHFNVYGRDGDPCPRCATPIRRLAIGGRASFFCPACQR